MGKHDRRNSAKMKRRKSQVKTKLRAKRKKQVRKAEVVPVKKTSKKAPSAASAAGS